MSRTSASFLERLQAQPDDAAWGRLVDLYTPLIRHTLRAAGVQPADQDDLVQEVFGVMLRDLAAFHHNGQPGAFRAWIRGITINRLREFWRDRGRQPQAGSDAPQSLDELEGPNNPLRQLWDQEHDRYIVRRLFELIEPRFEPATRLVFRRIVIDGHKPADVAAELGLSVNAVLLAKSRILRQLRQEVKGFVD